MFDWERFKPRHPDKILWDVVVVGTGTGGSTIGYSLAAQGYKVLFLELGNAVLASATPSRLSRLFRPKTMTTNLAPARQISVGDGAQTISFHAHGGAPGGTSTIYGERSNVSGELISRLPLLAAPARHRWPTVGRWIMMSFATIILRLKSYLVSVVLAIRWTRTTIRP